jgi:hypothetical protein
VRQQGVIGVGKSVQLPTERRDKDVSMTMFLRDGGAPVARAVHTEPAGS